ncbi:MAG: RNA polymerase sigma factor [Elusimicrobiota bacterium]
MGDGSQQIGFIEQLILRETPSAYRVAMSLTRNPEASKELVQEASYRILLNQRAFNASRSGTAWFQAVVRNLFIDGRRSFEYRRGVSLSQTIVADGPCYSELLPSDEPGVLEQLERGEDSRAVRRITNRLRKEHKEVLKLCDMQALSYEEAAGVLAVSVGTVRSRLFRARRAFRLLWAKENLAHGG